MAAPKVIVQLYPMMPANGEDDRKARRPIGADPDLYNRVIHEWTDIIKEADAMGIWGCSTIEHHLHSEGGRRRQRIQRLKRPHRRDHELRNFQDDQDRSA